MVQYVNMLKTKTKNLKILFIVPKFPARTYPGKTMGPDYLAGYLMRKLGLKNEDIEILDLDILPRDKLSETLRKIDFDIVGISFLSFQINEAMDVAKEVDLILQEKGARGKYKYTPIIVGNHGTAKCEEIVRLYPFIDAWIVGEGFEAMLEITKAIRDGNFHKKVNELEEEPGSKIINGWKLACETVDDYFPPYRKHHYADYNFEIFKGKKTAQILTAFGCPGSCVYCFEGTHCPTMRARSLKSIKDELEQLVKEGYEAVYIDDSTFTYNRKRTLEIVAVLREFHEKYGLVWAFNTRVDCLDDELIKIISESGCVYMFCGVESLSPSVIEGMNKVNKTIGKRIFEYYNKGSEKFVGSPICTGKEYVEKVKEVFASMKKYNVVRSAFLIFGGPSKNDGKIEIENFDQAKETIRTTVWELEPNYISINILRFIPDATISNAQCFSNIRPVNDNIHAGYFSSKWLDKNHINHIKNNHPIYVAYEAAGDRYPIPPKMTPEYCYQILEELVNQVNEYYKTTGREITIVVDKEFAEKYLKKDKGFYILAKFEEMKKEVSISALELEQMKIFTKQFLNKIKTVNQNKKYPIIKKKHSQEK